MHRDCTRTIVIHNLSVSSSLILRTIQYQMKRTIFLICLVLTACNHSKQSAQELLQQAYDLYTHEQYNSAKQILDSLKSSYPNAYDAQKKAIVLMRQIEQKEQERNISFCDSALIILQKELEEMKMLFGFEKTKYDRVGRYTDKLWNPATESGCNHIRTSVTETGELVLTAVYQSNTPLKLHQLKASLVSGEYAETQSIAYDGGLNYRFQDSSGKYYEILTFQNNRDNGLIAFIYQYPTSKIELKYIGQSSSFARILSEAEKKSLIRTCDFSFIFSEINQLQKTKEKAEKRLEYLNMKLR